MIAEQSGAGADESGAGAVATEVDQLAESSQPSKKETSLREFLGKMDEYAPIVCDPWGLSLRPLFSFYRVAVCATVTLTALAWEGSDNRKHAKEI